MNHPLDRTNTPPSQVARTQYFSISGCPICGGNTSRRIFPIDNDYVAAMTGIVLGAGEVGICKCTTCAHEYISPTPTREFLGKFYASYMASATQGFYADRIKREIPVEFVTRYRPHIAEIKHLAPHAKKMLDIGCGVGMFLRLAQRDGGYDVEGCEPNVAACKALLAQYGITAHPEFIEDLMAPDCYDVVTAWDILEHTSHPIEVLAKIRELLRPGGLLVMEVPCRDSFVHQLSRALFKMSGGLIKRPLHLIYGLHHLQYFDSATLFSLIERSGFRMLKAHRVETPIHQLKKTSGSAATLSTLKRLLYNWAITAIFFLAKATEKENKIILFAERAV